MDLIKKAMEGFLEEIASKKPAPGGGSAAALAGSLAAALVEMVSQLTATERMKEISVEAEKIRRRLTKLIDEDCEAFRQFVKAPENEKGEAVKHVALVPLETAKLSYRIIGLADEIAREGNRNAITDAGVASLLASAAVQGACLNVRINLCSVKDEGFRKVTEEKLEQFVGSSEKSRATMKFIRGKL